VSVVWGWFWEMKVWGSVAKVCETQEILFGGVVGIQVEGYQDGSRNLAAKKGPDNVGGCAGVVRVLLAQNEIHSIIQRLRGNGNSPGRSLVSFSA